MILPQALLLNFHVSRIVGVVPGNLLPIVPEMASGAVFLLQFQIRLLYLFQQGGVVPGSTVMDSGMFVAMRAPYLLVSILARCDEIEVGSRRGDGAEAIST